MRFVALRSRAINPNRRSLHACALARFPLQPPSRRSSPDGPPNFGCGSEYIVAFANLDQPRAKQETTPCCTHRPQLIACLSPAVKAHERRKLTFHSGEIEKTKRFIYETEG